MVHGHKGWTGPFPGSSIKLLAAVKNMELLHRILASQLFNLHKSIQCFYPSSALVLPALPPHLFSGAGFELLVSLEAIVYPPKEGARCIMND